MEKERERERVCVCVCMCMCVPEREKEREREVDNEKRKGNDKEENKEKVTQSSQLREDRQTGTARERERERERESMGERDEKRESEIERERKRERTKQERNRWRKRERERERPRDRKNKSQGERNEERERERGGIDRQILLGTQTSKDDIFSNFVRRDRGRKLKFAGENINTVITGIKYVLMYNVLSLLSSTKFWINKSLCITRTGLLEFIADKPNQNFAFAQVFYVCLFGFYGISIFLDYLLIHFHTNKQFYLKKFSLA